ncbi:MAG: DUF1987 domain-containing protein [Imperialibacter sp.]|jgi:hypothetical protein|uniref:DUF1987 domain-containing protein n=1 Tax=Imperialibacter sp. TaxID=2038411 RepID=UPI0032EBF691
MEKIYIQATEFTPQVHFDPSNGIIELRGNSNPHNSLTFYTKVIHTLEDYVVNDTRGLVANMAFRYFNTSSSKCLYDMFKQLNAMRKKGRQVTINWYYSLDDEDMYEVGKDFSDLMNLNFNFIAMSA